MKAHKNPKGKGLESFWVAEHTEEAGRVRSSGHNLELAIDT
jgi:hypothetical protein